MGKYRPEKLCIWTLFAQCSTFSKLSRQIYDQFLGVMSSRPVKLFWKNANRNYLPTPTTTKRLT